MARTQLSEVYVWAFLPHETEPVVCGRLIDRGTYHDFGYGRSYLETPEAFQLDAFEMPLERGLHRSRHDLHGALRDAAPDAWGRRVVMYRLGMDYARGERELRELDFLLSSGSERVGALHFQLSADRYLAPEHPDAALDILLRAADLLEQNQPLPPELEAALLHGSSIGGARPKALLNDHGRARLIAKFSSNTDTWPVVRAEALGMRLAAVCGIDVAPVRLEVIEGKDVLLVDRFDRVPVNRGTYSRRHFFSALTALGLSEIQARDATYPDFADFLSKYSVDPEVDCHELYHRMVFNMMIGNTDDHARNHAVFWDGRRCRLTPAYDVCVIRRVGEAAGHAMAIGAHGNLPTLENALSMSARFLLKPADAKRIHDELRELINENWRDIAQDVGLGAATIRQFDGTAILAPSLFR